jgi:dsRNA-specific ribonuclease
MNNSKLFNVAVVGINGEKISEGNGPSKKKAEQMASKHALIKLKVIEDC